MKELPAIVAKTKVGKNVKVKIWRNQRELTKNVLLGRLETSEDFKVSEKKKEPVEKQTSEIENLKITVRLLTKEDIKTRKLPNQITGVVVTNINDGSPLKNTTLAVNHIITEAQKKKIKSIDDLKNITQQVMSSNQKTILLATYNNQNQRRYLGVKLK
jgi:serine protease Do